MRLHYAQLGKTHLEAFFAKDDIIHDKNLTELRYLTGEFDICFNEDISPVYHPQLEAQFYAWLKEKGAENNGPFGFAVVARLDRTQFASPVPLDILKELFNYDDVCKISLSESGVVHSREYNYLWNEPGEEVQMKGGFIWRVLSQLKSKICGVKDTL